MEKKDPIVYIFMHRLTGEQAYMAALVLQQMINALWRTYGDDMADFEGRVFPDEPSPFTFTYGYDRGDDNDENEIPSPEEIPY